MIIIALVMGFSKLFFWQDTFILKRMMDDLFNTATVAFDIAIGMVGMLCLWMGIMKIGEDSGAVNLLSRFVNPFFSKLFPSIPANHPAMGSIMLNFSANMLGLDNAATPSGLRAMQQLQELNTEKDKASDAQIMFLVLNASGLTIIPVSILAARAAGGSKDPMSVFIPILLTTYFATIGGLVFVAIKQKINLLQRTILLSIGSITAFILGTLYYLSSHPDMIDPVSRIASTTIVFFFIGFFVFMSIRSKTQAFESFVEGAKSGFEVALNILPFLVSMLAAISLFKSCGALMDLLNGLKWLLMMGGMKAIEFIDALPVMLMKPFSGSGARGLMIDNMKAFGPDSFVSNLSATFQGSTETTFYVLSVYFGSVKIKNSRYAATAGLFCDLVGAVAAIIIAYIFFT